jgi:hypothetical protein
MSKRNNLSKTITLEHNQKAIEGVDKYIATAKTVVIAGTSYTPAALKAVLQAEIDGNNAAAEARSQYKQQVVAARVARSKGRAARMGLKAWVFTNHGADAVQVYEAFGFSAPQAPQRTVQAKADASAKGTATRKAKKEAIASIDAATPKTPAQPAAVVVAASKP